MFSSIALPNGWTGSHLHSVNRMQGKIYKVKDLNGGATPVGVALFERGKATELEGPSVV